jgi:hypothetical protein
MDPNLENVLELRVSVLIDVLLLDANSSLVVELACKHDVVAWLNLEVVARAQRVQHPVVTLVVSHLDGILQPQSDDVDSILVQNHEVVGFEDEPLDSSFPKLV